LDRVFLGRGSGGGPVFGLNKSTGPSLDSEGRGGGQPRSSFIKQDTCQAIANVANELVARSNNAQLIPGIFFPCKKMGKNNLCRPMRANKKENISRLK